MQPSLRPPDSLSIYIHVPFCVQKCGYCDFYSVTANDPAIVFRTIASTLDELVHYYEHLQRPLVSSLYIGGGTPSSIGLRASEKLLQGIFETPGLRLNTGEDFELTVEVNPESVSPDLLGLYRQSGVNRLSVGVQSFQERFYRIARRAGSPELAAQALALIRRNWQERLSLDLMTAFPGETPAEGITDLRRLLSYEPEHISLYTLSIEEGTPLAADVASGKVTLPGDAQTGVWERQIEMLADAGFEHYEVSNFALPGCRSRHNMSYWLLEPYLGCGPAAVSTLPGTEGPLRVENPHSVQRYNTKRGNGSGRGESFEIIPPVAFFLEHLMVGLRVSEGVQRARLERIFGIDPAVPLKKTLSKWENMVEIDAERIRLTEKGRTFLDSFLVDAALEIERSRDLVCLWP